MPLDTHNHCLLKMLLEWGPMCGQEPTNHKDAHFKIHLWTTESVSWWWGSSRCRPFPRQLCHTRTLEIITLLTIQLSHTHHFNHGQNVTWCRRVSSSLCSNSDTRVNRGSCYSGKGVGATKWEELSSFRSGNRNSWVLCASLMVVWSFFSFIYRTFLFYLHTKYFTAYVYVPAAILVFLIQRII